MTLATIAVFEAAGVDVVAVNAAGCGSSMKEFGHLLRHDPAYASHPDPRLVHPPSYAIMMRMKRTTIVAEESVLHRLRQLADTRGISFGEIVREALEEKLEREQPPPTFLDIPFEPPPGWPSAREFSENDLYRAEDVRGG